MNNTIAFIGAGNMGASIIDGLLACGYDPIKIWATNTDPAQLENLQQKYPIQATADNVTAVKTADVIVLAVKPKIIPLVVQEIAPHLKKGVLIISIAAGVPIKNIVKELPAHMAIIRTMPNMPAQIRCGATGLYANEAVTEQQKSIAGEIFNAIGISVWVEQESDLDIITAISGNGPAYFFLIMEIMQKVAVEMGLSVTAAKLLTLQTALGAAKMASKYSGEVTELRKNVTSPGGTTEAAINVLENGKLRELFSKALQAALQRAHELGA